MGSLYYVSTAFEFYTIGTYLANNIIFIKAETREEIFLKIEAGDEKQKKLINKKNPNYNYKKQQRTNYTLIHRHGNSYVCAEHAHYRKNDVRLKPVPGGMPPPPRQPGQRSVADGRPFCNEHFRLSSSPLPCVCMFTV